MNKKIQIIIALLALVLMGAAIYFYGSTLIKAVVIGAGAALLWQWIRPDTSKPKYGEEEYSTKNFLTGVLYTIDRMKNKSEVDVDSPVAHAYNVNFRLAIGYLYNESLIDVALAKESIEAVDTGTIGQNKNLLRHLGNAIGLAIAKHDAREISESPALGLGRPFGR